MGRAIIRAMHAPEEDAVRSARRAPWFGVLIALAIGGCGEAAEVVRPLTGRADVDEIFAEYDRAGSPGCALGVIQNGEFIYRRGYGLANIEHGVPLDADSVFRIASVSKQFTGMVLLLLDESGALSLDDPLERWVPEMDDLGPITIRHLIHHTSGLRDYLELVWLAGYRDEDYYDADELLGFLSRQRDLNFAPGEEFRYSNTGYFLMSVIAERAGGKDFPTLADELIFAPLGMTNTQFYDDPSKVVPKRAYGYYADDDGDHWIAMTTLPIVGDGGVFTSVNDLLAWDRNFYDNRLGSGDPELIRRWITPGRLNDGTAAGSAGRGGYAAGIQLGEYRDVRQLSHSGGFAGFSAHMARFPDQRTTVVTLCNEGGAWAGELSEAVAEVFLAAAMGPAGEAAEDEEPEAEADDYAVPVSRLRQYQGRYVSRELGVTYVVELRDGRLVVGHPHSEWQLTPREDDRFADTDNGLVLEFRRNSAGRIDGFAVDAWRATGVWFERVG